MSTSLMYRREIDGLRSVAVVPVILFHAGFGVFSGGYVGVDVFFVISGYLITTILINELEQGNFSIAGFYERRARRILPALFVVMLACLPFAYMWMLPSQLKDFAQSLVAVVTFSSNILFWREDGYFAAAAELKPLLHTWSLAVEEQYYLLFPIFLMLAWRFGRKRVFWTVVVIAAVSLLMAEWGWRNKPSANFYLAPTRAWELFVGSICAFLTVGRSQRSSNGLSAIGLAMIVFSIFAYDANTPFPSVYALVPVVGTALIILFAAQGTWVARLLSMRAFVGIGLISYSAYLWHQPLFAFARLRSFTEPSEYLMAALAVAALLLAWATWRFVERPTRNKKFASRRIVFSTAMGCSLLFISAAVSGFKSDGFIDRFDISKSVYETLIRSDRALDCFDKDEVHIREDWLCEVGQVDVEPTYFIFGDSHSVSFFPAIDVALNEMKQSGYFSGASGCTPFLGIYSLRNDQVRKNCHDLNNRVFDFVRNNNISKVILVARWTYYTDGGYSGENFSFIGLTENSERSRAISRNAFEAGLKRTIEAYKDIGVELIIVPQVPQQKHEPLVLYAEASILNRALSEVSVKLLDHKALQSFVNRLFEVFDAKLLDFTNTLCGSDVCLVGTLESSFYFDDDHLSVSGGNLLIEATIDFLNSQD